MNRKEYMTALEKALSILNTETKSAALAFYAEMLDDRIEDGMDELSAVASMENPQDIVAQLAREAREEQPIQGVVDGQPFSIEIVHAPEAGQSAHAQAAQEQDTNQAHFFDETAAFALENARKAIDQALQAATHALEDDVKEKVSQKAKKIADEKKKMVQEMDGGSYEYQEMESVHPADALRAVRIRALDCSVQLLPSQDDQVHLCYHTCEDDPYTVSCQDGVLSLESTRPHKGWKRGFSISFTNGFRMLWSNQSTPPIQLFVPADSLLDLDIATSNGSVKGENLQGLCAVALSTSNSRITLENASCKSLNLSTSNGRIELNQVCSKQQIHASTSNARIEARQITAGKMMELATSNGRLVAQDASAQEEMTLVTSNGNITVGRLQAADLTLRTSNGKIQGALPGKQADWAIESATSNGKNSLPKHQAGKKPLSVRTSNSSIDLVFEE